MSSTNIHLSIVIPLFNEQGSVAVLRAELMRSVQQRMPACELLLVDDGSTDGTWAELAAWAAADSSITLIRHTENLGQAASIRTGMIAASGRYVVVLDADLQDPPSLIIELLEMIETSNLEMVAAQRASRAGESALKRLTAWIYYRIMALLLPFAVTRDAGEFRIVSQRCIEKLRQHQGYVPIMRIFLDSIATSRGVLPFARQSRQIGSSHYSWGGMIRLAIMTLSYVSAARLIAVGTLTCLSLFATFALGSHTASGVVSLLFALVLGTTTILTLLGKHYASQSCWSPEAGTRLIKASWSQVS